MKHKPIHSEQKYYGIHACLALWEKRAQDVIRVYVNESNIKIFNHILKWCSLQKKAYHIVSNEELNKITDSVHHEGVCILAKEPREVSFAECLKNLQQPKMCLLYLDGVQNPHNIGSIIRSCAHFGIPYVLGDKLPKLSPSACRIAKGGAEVVKLIQLDKPAIALSQLKKEGFVFIGTSSHDGESLYRYKLPPKTVVAFGSESSGMSQTLMKLATQNIQIPGTGAVESLNVSVATSLCLGEYHRQHGN